MQRYKNMYVFSRLGWIVFILIVCIVGRVKAQYFHTTSPSLIIGKSHQIYSYALEEDRTILVHLPMEYEKSIQNYPVLYVLDGEKHFHHVVSSADFLAQNYLIPPLIIIGVINVDRTKDFTPYKPYDSQFPSAGKADNFLRFLRKELFPWVQKNYRQSNDYRIIAGHSFGGLFAIYSLIKQPKLFDAYLAISPSLWWDNELYVDILTKKLAKYPLHHKRIFLAWGKEGSKMERPSTRLSKTLEAHIAENYDAQHEFMGKESHETIVNRAVYNGLASLFEEWPLQRLIDLSELKAHYKHLSIHWGFSAIPPEQLVDDLAYQWMSKQEVSYALELLRYNTEKHRSPFTYYRLGEAYELIGEQEQAQNAFQAAYQIALKINDPHLERYRFKIE